MVHIKKITDKKGNTLMCKKQNTFNKMNPEMQRASISPSLLCIPFQPQLQGPTAGQLELGHDGYFHH